MKSRLSIIVPIYNVEHYLENSILSLKSFLNNKHVEIILVDDGSTDSSSKVSDDLSKRFNNIVTYHRKNVGLSGARNFGLSKANGEYIYFFDSDDQLNDGFSDKLLTVLNISNNEDLILFTHHEISEDGSEKLFYVQSIERDAIQRIDKDTVFREIFGKKQESIMGYAPTKIYNRKLIRNLLFRAMNYEDLVFFVEAIEMSEQTDFLLINSPGYKYFRRKNSITRTVTEKNLLDKLKSIDLVLNIVRQHNENSNVLSHVFEMLFVGYLWTAKLNRGLKSKKVSLKIKTVLKSNSDIYFYLFPGIKNWLKFMFYRYL